MPCHVAGTREGLATSRAGSRAFAGMGALVSRQVAGLREGLAAGDAGVGAVAGMGAHVYRQAARRREGLAAGNAGIRAVAGMGAHVCRQVAGVRAGFPADGALKDELALRPTPFSRVRRIRVHTPSFTGRLIPIPLVPRHRSDHRRILLGNFEIGVGTGQTHFSDFDFSDLDLNFSDLLDLSVALIFRI